MKRTYNAILIDNADHKGTGLQAVEIRRTDRGAARDPWRRRCVRFQTEELQAVFLAVLREYARTMPAGQFSRMITEEVKGA